MQLIGNATGKQVSHLWKDIMMSREDLTEKRWEIIHKIKPGFSPSTDIHFKELNQSELNRLYIALLNLKNN